MDSIRKFFELTINEEVSVTLPYVEHYPQPFYSFNLMGKAQLNAIIAREIVKKIKIDNRQIDYLVTIETKAIALTQEIARLLNIEEYAVIRKSKKPYMEKPLSTSGRTIISGENTYWLDGTDQKKLNMKNVIIVDDVISTGGTIQSVFALLEQCNVNVSLILCAVTEGKKWKDFNGVEVISLAHIPLPGAEDDN